MAAARNPWTDRLLFLVLSGIWGLNFIFIKFGLADANPLWLAFLRALIGAAATAVIVTPLGVWHRLDGKGRRDAFLLGLPSTMGFYAPLFLAIQSVLPGIASVLTYTFPLWVAMLSPSVLGHRLTGWHWAAVGAGFLGVALISEIWSSLAHSVSLIAIVELLGAAVSWAVGTVLFQRRFHRTEMLEADVFQLFGGTVGLAVLVVVFAPPLPAPTPALTVALLWLGVLGTATAYTIWFTLLGRTRASTLSAYVFLVPVVALVASAVTFGERLSPVQFVGVVLVFLSIYGIARAPGSSHEPTEILLEPAD